MTEVKRYSQHSRFGEVEMPSMAEVVARQHAGVYEVSDRVGFKQRLGVRISEQSEAVATIIRPMPITDEVGRAQLADDQGVYRAVSGARIIGVDFPGMGRDTGPITQTQRQALKGGSFAEVAEAQWDALGEALAGRGQTYKDLGRVVLWGSSLGGAQIAGLYAAKPEEVEITDLVFQITPWKTALNGLIRGFAEASKDRDYYYELDGENYHEREGDSEWIRRIATRQKIGAAVLSAWAMSRGRIFDDLSKRKLNGLKVHLMNAEHDIISPTEDNQAAVEELWSRNASVGYELMNGEYHAIQQSRRVVGLQQKDIIDAY